MLDHNGNEVKVGDIVWLPVRIVEQHGGADFTHITVETEYTNPPSHTKVKMELNSAQVEMRYKSIPTGNVAEPFRGR